MYTIYKNTRSKRTEPHQCLIDTTKPKELIAASKTYHYIFPNFSEFTEISSQRCKRGIEFEISLENNWGLSKSYKELRWTKDNCKSIRKELFDNLKLYDSLTSVPLLNSFSKVGGIADLLIRSDKVSTILKVDYPYYNDPIHWVIIEIKYSDKVNDYYRNQTFIYNQALKHIQKGYCTKCSYIFLKDKTSQLVVFNNDDLIRYRHSIQWCRLSKKHRIQSNITLPNITLPNLSNNSNKEYYIYFLDIELSIFTLTTKTPIIWYICIMEVDKQTSPKNITLKHYISPSFDPSETYHSVHFLLNNIKDGDKIYIWTEENYDWISKDWINISKYIPVDTTFKDKDKLILDAWKFNTTKNTGYLHNIQQFGKQFLKRLYYLILN